MEANTKKVRFRFGHEKKMQWIDAYLASLYQQYRVKFTVEYEFHEFYKANNEGQYRLALNLNRMTTADWQERNLKQLLNSLFSAAEIWLDDVRPRPDRFWIHLRSYEDFAAYISAYGLPARISFDHDLGDGESGYDCAKLLVDYCLDHSLPLPQYTVHIQNPVGRENIEKLFLNFKKHHS